MPWKLDNDFLLDSVNIENTSVELLEKSKNAFKSPLVAEARENLEKIQKTKNELFENIINSL